MESVEAMVDAAAGLETARTHVETAREAREPNDDADAVDGVEAGIDSYETASRYARDTPLVLDEVPFRTPDVCAP
jgi:hypothetical protein